MVVQLDGRSMALESGRYMETVGKTLYERFYMIIRYSSSLTLGWMSK